jgi:hypothetical protein
LRTRIDGTTVASPALRTGLSTWVEAANPKTVPLDSQHLVHYHQPSFQILTLRYGISFHVPCRLPTQLGGQQVKKAEKECEASRSAPRYAASLQGMWPSCHCAYPVRKSLITPLGEF